MILFLYLTPIPNLHPVIIHLTIYIKRDRNPSVLCQKQSTVNQRNSVMNEEMNNFTPRAQQVLALARKKADRLNHNFIGTEHVLLGLIELREGVAFNVLKRLNLQPEAICLEVEKLVGTGPDQSVVGVIPYTPRVKKVLSLASKEAKALSHVYIGTEHILLGLLREGDGVAFRVLTSLGLNIEILRQEVLNELDPNYKPETTKERKDVTDMTYEVLTGYITVLSITLPDGMVCDVVGAINTAKVRSLSRLIDVGYFRTGASPEVGELVDGVIRGSDNMDIFQLCIIAYRKMLTPDESVVSRVGAIFSRTTPGSSEERRFGTVLQMLTGGPVQRVITLDFLSPVPVVTPSGGSV